MEETMTNLLITGSPGCGKTTLLKKVASKLKKEVYGGFYTEETRDTNKNRTGFKITSFGYEENKGIMSNINIVSNFKVGKYGVDIETIDRVGVSAIDESMKNEMIKIIIIDEIGKMELLSFEFQIIVERALNSNKLVIASIMSNDKSYKFVQKIKERKDTRLITLDKNNRSGVEQQILSYLIPYLNQMR